MGSLDDVIARIEERIPFCPPFIPMHTVLEDRTNEHFILDRFEVSKEEARHFNVMSIMSYGHTSANLRAGTYMRLRPKGKDHTGFVWMSDTPNERATCLDFVEHAHENILIGGLGLGMVILPLLTKPEVTSITVIEKEDEVAEMIWPQIQDYQMKIPKTPALTLILGDARTHVFPKTMKFQTIWMDIWGDMSTDDWEDIKAVKRYWRRYLDYKDPYYYNHCWHEDHIRNMVRQERYY